jgi:DNA polymerase III epsilon subunit-like protein
MSTAVDRANGAKERAAPLVQCRVKRTVKAKDAVAAATKKVAAGAARKRQAAPKRASVEPLRGEMAWTVVFDTETTGLPKNWKAPASDVDNWPRLVQIGWVLLDESGAVVKEAAILVKPNGSFVIPKEAEAIHGISTEHAEAKGVPAEVALETFRGALVAARRLVAHNLDFDETVVRAECFRAGISPDNLFGSIVGRVCTKTASTALCRLPPFRYGHYKWPTLLELYQKLFCGADFEGAHDALTDAKAAARCFLELAKTGIVDGPVQAVAAAANASG